MVVLDSLRYDAWLAAAPAVLGQLGPVQRRWSYASWTAPSHYNLLTGLVPHSNPTGVFASEYYKEDFLRYNDRLGLEGMEFRSLLPGLYLPGYLREAFGYRTQAMVSMPVLNPATALNRDFDDYRLMPRHNDMAAMVEALTFEEGRPTFTLLNVGETHYPYALPDEPPSAWPRISGVHGVVRELAEPDAPAAGGVAFFSAREMTELRDRQVAAVAYLDTVFARLFDRLPAGTWVIVTSDHGDLFGEDGFFGHGPVFHEKVFEVPFVEGPVP
jgi:arylsulfatase A-like enzyme